MNRQPEVNEFQLSLQGKLLKLIIMKQVILLFIGLSLTFMLYAQVSITMNVTAGGLSEALTPTELSTVTSLTLTGTINVLDIESIQNQMPLITVLDLSQTTITATTGFSANWFPGPSIWKNSGNIGGLNKPLLISLKLPSTLEVIGSGGFSGCSGLTSITIPPTVTTIGWSAFEGCAGLTSIAIPPSVTNLNEYIFTGCSGLTEVSIPTSITNISKGMFQGCSSLTSLTIPSSVTRIESSAFTLCSGLTSLVIPASVESIGNIAFFGCKNLTSIYLYKPVPLNTANNSFDDAIKSTCTLYVPFGSVALYANTEEWKDFNNVVEMPELKLSQTTANLEAKQGSTATVEITSDVIWTASCDKSWITINPTSGTGSHTLAFIADANPAPDPRTAIVTFNAKGFDSKTIVITQQTNTVGLNELDQNFAQFKCYPNPFMAEMNIEIQNPRQAKIKVDIYNMAGQLIKNLLIGNTSEHVNLTWNGANEGGQQVQPGIYICKMNNQSKQLIFVKP